MKKVDFVINSVGLVAWSKPNNTMSIWHFKRSRTLKTLCGANVMLDTTIVTVNFQNLECKSCARILAKKAEG